MRSRTIFVAGMLALAASIPGPASSRAPAGGYATPPGDVVPVHVALVSAGYAGGIVRVVWAISGAEALSATVERSVADEAWTAIGRGGPDGTGELAWEDRDVAAGGRYGYRLRYTEKGKKLVAGEAWVEVPAADSPPSAGSRFALHGARPNPATSSAEIWFSLPDAAPARLEVWDPAGRLIVGREVGPLGAGAHRLSLVKARVVQGVYFVRLTRGQDRATRRFVWMR